jgi:hypothetical protein
MSEIENRRVEDRWSIDHKIPLGILVAVLIQTLTGVWWMSALNSRVNELEKITEKFSNEYSSSYNDQGALKDRVTRLEVTLAGIDGKLDDINYYMRDLNENRPQKRERDKQ